MTDRRFSCGHLDDCAAKRPHVSLGGGGGGGLKRWTRKWMEG